MNGIRTQRLARALRLTPVLLAFLAGAPLAGCAASFPGFGSVVAVDDAAISAGVRSAIGLDPELTVSDLDVNTYQGIVRLSGFVSSADNVAAAASVARTVKGVKSVRNDLRLK